MYHMSKEEREMVERAKEQEKQREFEERLDRGIEKIMAKHLREHEVRMVPYPDDIEELGDDMKKSYDLLEQMAQEESARPDIVRHLREQADRAVRRGASPWITIQHGNDVLRLERTEKGVRLSCEFLETQDFCFELSHHERDALARWLAGDG